MIYGIVILDRASVTFLSPKWASAVLLFEDCFAYRGLVMRFMAVLAVLSTLLAVGGCFHHSQMTTAEPIELPPLK